MRAKDLLKEFKRYDVGPYIEVPCSILAPIITEIERDRSCELLNPVNEAVAMGLAAGSYMATNKIPAILMQNSGLCNTINAISSLNQIYKIPALLIISWRGRPGSDDAPEHIVIGAKLEKLLRTLEIPYWILSDKNFKEKIERIMKLLKDEGRPAAMILRDGLAIHGKAPLSKESGGLSKREAIEVIIGESGDRSRFVTTNGFISREMFNLLNEKGLEKARSPFYMLGSMGHALSIGLGLARHVNGGRKIVVLDGDGGCLMHLGSMASVANGRYSKLIHVVLDDGAYASTGCQKTVSRNIDLCKVAQGCGYKNIHECDGGNSLRRIFRKALRESGPTFIRVLANAGEKNEKPRVSDTYSCEEIKENFIKNLKNSK